MILRRPAATYDRPASRASGGQSAPSREDHMLGKSLLVAVSVAIAVALWAFTGTPASADDIIVGLITKTENNPFFVKMREGAQAKAKELGLDLRTFAGKYDGDNDSQVAAIENLISAGAKGFAIVPSDSTAIVPTIKKARDAG